MEFLSLILEKALILIPALNILGAILKEINLIPDRFIPLILLGFGIAGSLAIVGVSVEGFVQGILITGTAVYGNQIVKQLKKSE